MIGCILLWWFRLNQSFQWPFREVYGTAIFDFEPQGNNQLQLRAGCQVLIIGKDGDDKGWWRGKVGDIVSKATICWPILIQKLIMYPKTPKNIDWFLQFYNLGWLFPKGICSNTSDFDRRPLITALWYTTIIDNISIILYSAKTFNIEPINQFICNLPELFNIQRSKQYDVYFVAELAQLCYAKHIRLSYIIYFFTNRTHLLPMLR